MKFNSQLKEALNRYEKKLAAQNSAPTAQIREADKQPEPPKLCDRPIEKVVGGDILWKPIDRAAAMLLAKAPWWAQPIHETKKAETEKQNTNPPRAEKGKTGIAQARDFAVNKKPKRKRHMKRSMMVNDVVIQQQNIPVNGDYISNDGLKITMINGEPFFKIGELDSLIALQISKLPAETRPNVLAAQDARRIITELLTGIGGEMEKFNANTKKYLEDIRQTRFAVVSETASMTKELKDVRQFFLGSDYNEQVTRLREFVDLCERLQKLKQSGFLDSVADTMLRLSERQTT